jgi:hypothetical protein
MDLLKGGAAQILLNELAPRRYPRGVHRCRSIEETNRAREAWESP